MAGKGAIKFCFAVLMVNFNGYTTLFVFSRRRYEETQAKVANAIAVTVFAFVRRLTCVFLAY